MPACNDSTVASHRLMSCRHHKTCMGIQQGPQGLAGCLKALTERTEDSALLGTEGLHVMAAL